MSQHPAAIPEDAVFSIGDSPSLPPELAAGLVELLAPLDDEPLAGSPARSAHSPNSGLGGLGSSSQSFDTAHMSSNGGGSSGNGGARSAAPAAATAAVPLSRAAGGDTVPLCVPRLPLPAAAAAPAQPHQGSPPPKDGRLRRIFQTKTAGPALLAETLAAQDALPPAKLRGLLRSSKTESPSALSGLLQQTTSSGGGKGARIPLLPGHALEEAEEEPALFLPASDARGAAAPWHRPGFLAAQLFGLAWTLAFLGAGLGVGLHLNASCPDQASACSDPSDTIAWRVLFFLATLPAAAWCSRIFGWALVWCVSLVEDWAESHQRRAAKRAAEAWSRRCAEEQRRLAEQQRRDEAMRRKWEQQIEQLRGQQMEAASSRTLVQRQASGAADAAAAPAGKAAAPARAPVLPSMMSWQTELLQDIARQEGLRKSPAQLSAAAQAQPPAQARTAGAADPRAAAASSGDLPERMDSGLLMPPAPEPAGWSPSGKEGGAGAAAGGGNAGAGAEVEGAGGGSAGAVGWGLCRFILSLDLSYLVEHTQAQLRHAVFLGLACGMWALFWDVRWGPYAGTPVKDDRFWVFFRILLCLTLLLLAILLTRCLSSLAGIKLKRINHRQRMQELSKREALLQLLLSRGVEDGGDLEEVKQRLLPPGLAAELRGLRSALAAEEVAGGAAPERADEPSTPSGAMQGLRRKLGTVGRALRSVSPRNSAASMAQADQDLEAAADGGGSLLSGAGGGSLLSGAGAGSCSGRAGALGSPLVTGLAGTPSGSGRLGGLGSPFNPPAAPETPTSPASPASTLARGHTFAGTARGVLAIGRLGGSRLGGGGQRRARALTQQAGDLSKAHLLQDRERHFLEDELRLRYWKVEAVCGYTPAGQPVLGAEEGTVVSSEDSARKVGRFTFRNRIQAFLKLRRRLIQDAEAEAAALQQAAATRHAAAERAARTAAAASSIAGLGSAPSGGSSGAVGSPAAPSGNGFADVADRLGLADLFGGPADEPSEPAPGLGRPTLSASAGRLSAALPSGGAEDAGARRSLFAAGGGSGAAPSAGDSLRSLGPEQGPPRRRGFGKEDLRLFLEARGAAADTDYAFQVLDRDFGGWVTEENVVRMVRQLHKDRANMRASLLGTNIILRKLDWFIMGVLQVVFVLFYLLVWGVPFNESFYTAFSALLLAFSFIFQSTISNIYENVTFIFLVHPFDVGDTLLLCTNGAGEVVRHDVEEIHLSYTRLLDKDNGRVWWPNAVLRNTPFINLSTSGARAAGALGSELMEDSFHLLLDLHQAARQPDLLRTIKRKVDAYLLRHRGELHPPNPRTGGGGASVTYRDIQSPMAILMKVEWHYSHPGTSKERCAKSRTGLLVHVAQVLAELGVHFSWPLDQPAGPGRSGSGVLAPSTLLGLGRSGSGQLAGQALGAGLPRTSSGGSGPGVPAGGLGHARSTSGETLLTQRVAARPDAAAAQRAVAAQATGAAPPGSGPPGGLDVLTKHRLP